MSESLDAARVLMARAVSFANKSIENPTHFEARAIALAHCRDCVRLGVVCLKHRFLVENACEAARDLEDAAIDYAVALLQTVREKGAHDWLDAAIDVLVAMKKAGR